MLRQASKAADQGASEPVLLPGKHILVLSPTPTYPLDQGNRKRIYAWCKDLQDRGARIHFVYYPLEWSFSHLPADAMQRMHEQWDGFYLAPVTRSLHEWAKGEDHLIDEWFDRSIGDVLGFLFNRFTFDAFIVNYPFLSKAFEWCPSHTFKILDTHDKFTGRRKLLQEQGIQKEFFYTTAEQEKIALDRADLVWAIKDEEAEFFRTLTSKPVITLPHAEPLRPIGRERLPEDEGYLVLGMIGARNNVNLRNADKFLKTARPIFRDQLAPIKIRLAGGLCDDLTKYEKVNGVHLMGRVDSVDDFYRAVDVVIVPMTFSTGLKIKAIEAFATGKPIVAHAHAVEGIPVEHNLHQCTSDADVAQRCMELAYRPELLQELQAASLVTNRQLQRLFQTALDSSCSMMRKRPHLVLTLGSQFFDKHSLYRQHILQLLEYLRYLSSVTVYLDEMPTLPAANRFELLNGLGMYVKLVVGRAAADSHASEDTESSPGLVYAVQPLRELLTLPEVQAIWIEHLPEGLADALPARQVQIYAQVDSLQCTGHAADAIERMLSSHPRIITVSSELLTPFASGGDHIQVPYFRRSADVHWKKSDDQTYWLVGDRDQLPWMRAVYEWLRASGAAKVAMVVPASGTKSYPDAAWARDVQFVSDIVEAEKIYSDHREAPYLPARCISFGPQPAATGVLLEVLRRGGTPVVSFSGSLEEFLVTLEGLEAASSAPQLLAAQFVEFGNDSGYAHIWKNVKTAQTLRL